VRVLLGAARELASSRGSLAVAIAGSTGLSIEGVELAFARHLECDATDDDLAKLVAHAGDAARVAVILSANVFVGALRAIALARAASNDVIVRPSRRDSTFARALVLAAQAAGDSCLRLDDAFDVASFDAGEIHVYGRDATIAEVRAKARVRVHGHGSGMGVAWISPRAELTPAARALAADVVVFDQRGCLSPRVAIVIGDEARAGVFADALHGELGRLAAVVPRGRVPADERAAGARYAATMAYAGRALVGPEHAIGLAPRGAPLVLPPPYRHVHVATCASTEQGAELLRPLGKGIVAVGSDDRDGARAIAPPWARLSDLGEMQRPPLDGPVDLRDVALPH
jgi:hypothetical protein